MGRQYELSVLFRLIDKISDPMSRVGRTMGKLGDRVQHLRTKFAQLGEAAKRAGDKLNKIGKDLFLKLTVPLMAVGALSLKASMDFNKAMANVASLIPKSVERVKLLKKEVQDLSIRMGTSTLVMADGLYQVISALGDTADTMTILEINAKAARAGLATVKDAVDLTSAVMKGYGNVSVEAAKKAADLAFETVKLGQTTFPELAGSIGRVIPLAAQLGVKQEEAFALFATLTGTTAGSTEEVSTQIAGSLRAMLKPTPIMEKALKRLVKLGVISKATGKELIAKKGIVGAFRTMNDLAKGNEQLLADMFGAMEPLVAIFTLLGSQADTYNKKLEKMYKATGAMNEAFDVQTKGINKAGFEWEQFTVQIGVLSQRLGDALVPALRVVVTPLKELVNWLIKLNPAAQIVVTVILTLLGLVPLLIIALGALAASIGVLAGVSAAAWGIFGLFALAVIALATAAYFLIKHWKPVSAFFKKLWKDISEILDRISNWTQRKPIVVWFKKKFKMEGEEGKEGEEGGKKWWKFGLGKSVDNNSKSLITATAGTGKSETDINIKLTADEGTSASVEKVKKKKGDASVNVATVGYVGAH
jgi:TP901 family phage tail tape measure protein